MAAVKDDISLKEINIFDNFLRQRLINYLTFKSAQRYSSFALGLLLEVAVTDDSDLRDLSAEPNDKVVLGMIKIRLSRSLPHLQQRLLLLPHL